MYFKKFTTSFIFILSFSSDLNTQIMKNSFDTKIKKCIKIYCVHQTLDASNVIIIELLYIINIFYIVHYTHKLKEPKKTYHKTWLGLHVDSIFPNFWMSSRNYFKIVRAKIRGHYKCLFIPSYSMYIRQR